MAVKASCNRHDAHWTGFRIEHCCMCGATFSGTTAGDMHQVGDHAVFTGPNRRRCLTADEMLEKGMNYTINAHGTPIWRTGKAQEHGFWASRQESDSLPGQGWAPGPPASNEAVSEMEASA